MNDVVNKHRNKPKDIITVPNDEIFTVLPYLGIQSILVTQHSTINHVFTSSMAVLILRLSSETLAQLSFLSYKDRLNRSLRSKVVYKASCWDCDETKRRLCISQIEASTSPPRAYPGHLTSFPAREEGI